MTGRLIALKTYKDFMKKYKLRVTEMKDGKRKNKTIRQMKKEIYDYEDNSQDIIINGLYFNVPDE